MNALLRTPTLQQPQRSNRSSAPSRFAAFSGSCKQGNPTQVIKEEGSATVFSALLAAVTAASVSFAPDAFAVSGGGGLSKPLAYEDMSNQDLTKYKLTKANLRLTNFTNANLSNVSLFGCLAKGAIFSGANLTGADLESGFFEDADFTNAILEGAYVDNAQFINVKITGSDWTDVNLRKDVQKELCEIADGVNPVTGVDTRESLYCP